MADESENSNHFWEKEFALYIKTLLKCLYFKTVISHLGVFLKEITCDVDDYQRLMQKKNTLQCIYYSVIYNGEIPLLG